jgi:hypothetical protein
MFPGYLNFGHLTPKRPIQKVRPEKYNMELCKKAFTKKAQQGVEIFLAMFAFLYFYCVFLKSAYF